LVKEAIMNIGTNVEMVTELIEQHRRHILSIAHKVLRNSSDAEEVFQEVCVKIFQHLDQFRGEEKNMKGWVSIITFRTSIIMLRENRNNRLNSSLDLGGMENLIPQKDPRKQFDRRIFLNQLLGGLQKRERTILLLVGLEGLSGREAANRLNISEKALKMILFRIRKDIRDKYQF
jgi:RNA polymerase sigma-70 factor, ECF subfamily